MSENNIQISKNNEGNFSLGNLSSGQIKRVDIVDVDLVITAEDGKRYVLTNLAVEAMGEKPPSVIFSDENVVGPDLLKEIGLTKDLIKNDVIQTSEDQIEGEEEVTFDKEKEELQEELKELKEKIEQQEKQIEKQEQQAQEQQKQIEEQQQSHSKESQVSENTEASLEKLVQQAQKIQENLHTSDHDYVPPPSFNPPSNPPPSAPGVPPPISLTPVVTINIGNAVGTTVAGSNIYGGGGAANTGADAQIGPRNPLQFSAATITGTAGNDVIYTNGPIVGNADPSVDRSYNAKEIILNVAGYFTSLNSIEITGVPSGVSIQGATNAGGGKWILPSSYGTDGTPFLLVYDMDAWRGGSATFDIDITVSGNSTRGIDFSTTQSFRFMYVDVTATSQVTDNTLVYDVNGITKQIYVLPTADQPNIINSGDGDDMIYASRSHDTITVGDGNNTIYAYGGNDTIVTGTGDNTVDLGEGNNTITSLGGADVVTAGDGTNIVNLGDGLNQYTAGNGSNTVTTGLNDDLITVGSGTAVISAGAGNNTINTNGGAVTITSDGGNDTINIIGGSGSINAGDGNNTVSVTTGNFSIITGLGNDNITVGNGNNTINVGDGTNTLIAGDGTNTLIGGAGDDTFTVGDGNNTINVGDGNNTVTAGDGNNTITGGSGNDNFTAGDGDNTFIGGLGTNNYTAGTGNNTVDYSIVTTTAVNVSLLAGSASGTGLNDTFTNITNVIGGSLDDTISGNVQSNVLSGGDGDDTISGGGGNDTYYGGDGDDTITGGTGDDIIYGGAGDNYMTTGTSGADFLYGGSGNNTFLSQHAGVTYNGTNGAALGVGQYNTIDYAADTSGMVINLLAGFGSGGLANGDVYVASPVSGVNTINGLVAGSGSDNITDSNADDYILGGNGTNVYNINNGNDYFEGGTGQDQFISNGTGNKTFVGNGGNNYYDMGRAAENVVSGSGWDLVRYYRSNIGVLINFDSVDHTAVNSLGNNIVVSARSGAGWGVTANDANSYAIGDTFSGDSVNYFWGSSSNDVVWDLSTGGLGDFDGNSGVDYFFGGAANTLIRLTDNDRLDGGAGSDTIYANTTNSVTIYLDGSADINSNSIADYLDRGISSLTISAGSSPTGSALTYTGFAQGYSGTDYLKNIENILGYSGNDLLVGDANDNLINGRSGNNTMYGLGGNDTIYSSQGGVNIIDGGSGTDTLSFAHNWYQEGSATAAYVFLSDGTFTGASDKETYMGASNVTYDGMTQAGTFMRLTSIENITGSTLNDVLYGNASVNTIRAGSGDDIIAGNGGADFLYGEAGNDTFYIASGDVTTVGLIDGGTNTDKVVSAGLNVTAGSIVGSKFASIEVLDIRDSAGGGSYSMNANDITGLADNGTSSSVNLRLDTGDTFTATVGGGSGALSYVIASSTATNTIYYFYSDAGHAVADATNRVAILDVYTGTG